MPIRFSFNDMPDAVISERSLSRGYSIHRGLNMLSNPRKLGKFNVLIDPCYFPLLLTLYHRKVRDKVLELNTIKEVRIFTCDVYVSVTVTDIRIYLKLVSVSIISILTGD